MRRREVDIEVASKIPRRMPRLSTSLSAARRRRQELIAGGAREIRIASRLPHVRRRTLRRRNRLSRIRIIVIRRLTPHRCGRRPAGAHPSLTNGCVRRAGAGHPLRTRVLAFLTRHSRSARAAVRVRSEVVSDVGRGAQHLALAALIGGNLFGRVAMHPALTDISDKTERGKVLNRAWRRYGVVNSLALGTLVAAWLPGRLNTARARWLNPHQRRLVLAEDVAMGAVVITDLASAAGGVGFSHQAPGGAVPMTSGHDPAPEAPAQAARLKRVVNALGAANLVAGVALLAVISGLAQANFRRPLSRRTLRRRP